MKPDDLILVVEDNEDDVYFLRRALKAAGVASSVRIISNGRQALEYLRGTGQFTDRQANPLPRVIFLDLKIPYVHGLEVLAAIRADPGLKHLPVAILTSSSEGRDREQAAELGAMGYYVKPPTREMLATILSSLTTPASLPGAVQSAAPDPRTNMSCP